MDDAEVLDDEQVTFGVSCSHEEFVLGILKDAPNLFLHDDKRLVQLV